jgi:excisionase family DNA binding protein
MHITTTEAAKRLGLTDTRIRAMLDSGILQGEKFGPVWMVDADSVARRKRAMSAGRLPKGGRPKSE